VKKQAEKRAEPTGPDLGGMTNNEFEQFVRKNVRRR
jgi:hypothetical protein